MEVHQIITLYALNLPILYANNPSMRGACLSKLNYPVFKMFSLIWTVVAEGIGL